MYKTKIPYNDITFTLNITQMGSEAEKGNTDTDRNGKLINIRITSINM